MTEYNITRYTHGMIVDATCVRAAKNIFRKYFPKEKIFYAKVAGRINPKHIY